jgi:hypothetical protein
MASIPMRIRQKWSNYQNRREVKRQRAEQLAAMAAGASATTREIGKVLSNVVDQVTSDVERRYFDRIESLRDTLIRSNETLEIIDFGAGEPGENRTKEQMEAGKKVTFTVKHLCEHTSHGYPWSHLLSKLAAYTGTGYCLELGTCIGMSGSYLLAGLASAGREGSLVTLEGASPYAQMAKRNFEQLGFSRYEIVLGRFQDTLSKVLATHGRVGFAYIDGHHDGEATVGYFRAVANAMDDGGLFLFDDIKWYESMRAGWKAIANDPRSQLIVDLGVMGIVSVGTAGSAKESFTFTL